MHPNGMDKHWFMANSVIQFEKANSILTPGSLSPSVPVMNKL